MHQNRKWRFRFQYTPSSIFTLRKKMIFIFCLFFCLLLITFCDCACNTTLYNNWLATKYQGILSADAKFWRYQTQKQIVLSNNLALQLVVAACQKEFDDLFSFRAGKSGPVSIQDAYRVMCHNYCLQSDVLHQFAMKFSGCSCLDLSTKPSDPTYKYEGDWCEHNSARVLCNTLSYCGVWKCKLEDFMCPRYEWNKKNIPLKV